MAALVDRDRLFKAIGALGTRRLALIAVSGVLVFVAVIGGAFLLNRPAQEALYAGLTIKDVGRIASTLREAGMMFDVSSDGTKILVARGRAPEMRMFLAERGLPAQATAGYELFDKLGPLGLTSFMQDVTRLRAIEGELARSIEAMKGVRAARVHIVMSEQTSLKRTRPQPTASVVVRPEGLGEITATAAIRHVVAAAVPGLALENVSVLSTDGAVLAAAGDASATAPTRMLELERSVGASIRDNVRRTLAPYLGAGNVEVSVAARLNLDRRQTSETSFDPDSKVERSTRVLKESGQSQNAQARAPVSVAQNIPTEAAAPGAGDSSKKSNDRREELTNFEVNSKSISTTSEGYRVEQLALAVVVNRKRLAGSATEQDARLQELEKLASDAAGLDRRRGDRITITAVDFAEGAAALEPLSQPTVVELVARQAGTIATAIGGVALAAVVLLLGVRPLTNALKSIAEAPALEKAGPVALGHAGRGDVQNSQINELRPSARLASVVERDQDKAVAVMKSWLNARVER
jgi:flagellar M-ring protein FliF